MPSLRAQLSGLTFATGLMLCLAPIAEEIRIPIGAQAADAAHIDLPSIGMNQMRVLALFGEPLEKGAARGKPPISQWKYTEFVVYFEYDHVIHSVRKFHPNTTTAELIE
jgi:hypothetical protein